MTDRRFGLRLGFHDFVCRRPMSFQPRAFGAYDCLSDFREKVAGVRDSGGDVGDSESVLRPYVGKFRAGDSGILFDCLDEGFGLGLHGLFVC